MPGHDGIHGFWFKKFTSIHDRLALEMNKCLQTAYVPEWMTKGRTALIQKDPNKGTAPNNYRRITCLTMMWKILIADHRIKLKEYEKNKYHNLARELRKLWNMQVTIIPIVIGAFGTVTKGLRKGLEDLEVVAWMETIQTTALLRTARILRRVLET